MRTRPHPIRVLWKTAQLTMIVAGMLVVVLTPRTALFDGFLDELRVALLTPLAVIALVAALIATVTEGKAAGISPASWMCSGSASGFIAVPPGQVWACIKSADPAAAIDPRIKHAFQVPGTPEGEGEQQCFIIEASHSSILEASIIEIDEIRREGSGYFVRIRCLTGWPSSAEYEIAEAEGGTNLTYTIEQVTLRWTPHITVPGELLNDGAANHVASIKRFLEAEGATEV